MSPNPEPVAPTHHEAAPALVAAPRPSLLSINSIPVSNVVLDGRPLGQTPKMRVRVKPGGHSVVFVKDGKRVVRGARVGAGESVTVSARL